MGTKVQSQLLVNQAVRDRADALSLVLNTSRAEVYRMALEGAGLAGLEATYADQVNRLKAIAEGMKMPYLDMARKAVQDEYTLDDLEGRKRYPVKK